MSALELRTYRAAEGKREALLARFRDHTIALFEKHGMRSGGYWRDEADPDVLVYLIRHVGDPSANWQAFRDDPEWQRVAAESSIDGPLAVEILSSYLVDTELTGVSPLDRLRDR